MPKPRTSPQIPPQTHARSHAPAAPGAGAKREGIAPCPVEDIAQAYLVSSQGDAGIALRCAIADALSDLMEAERRARENSRLISRGYAMMNMCRPKFQIRTFP